MESSPCPRRWPLACVTVEAYSLAPRLAPQPGRSRSEYGFDLVRLAGFEPATRCLEGSRSVQLSYRRPPLIVPVQGHMPDTERTARVREHGPALAYAEPVPAAIP